MEKKWTEPFDVINLIQHQDERGFLFEILRFQDFNIPGKGQLYTFSINPHKRRGDHYHFKKMEWFTCVSGEAIVLLTSQDGRSKNYTLLANEPSIIFAGLGTTHALMNIKDEPAIIVSYGSTQHEIDDNDTFFMEAYPGFQIKE